VHAPIARIDLRRQGVEVGRAQLGQGAVLEQPRREGVILGQIFEHLLPGRERATRCPSLGLEAERLEQDLRDLGTAVQIDGLAGHRHELDAQRIDLLGRLA
jgi:hypothetical protein